MVILLKCSL